MNPVATKELRQAVRSRLVTVLLLVFLLALLGVTVAALLVGLSDLGRMMDARTYLGRTIQAAVFGVLRFTTVLFIPLFVAIRLAGERSDTNLDLQFITALTPGMIVRGKLLAGTTLAALFFAAAMPFMALTYLLRGVDVLMTFVSLFETFLSVVVILQWALLFAALPLGRIARIIIGIFLVFILFVMALSNLGSSTLSMFLVLSHASARDIMSWTYLLLRLALFATELGLGYVLSVAFLAPPTANRMLPFRVFMTVALLVWYGVLTLTVPLSGSSGQLSNIFTSGFVFTAWHGTAMIVLTVAIVFAVCERDTLGPRVQRGIPHSLLRWLAFPFFSGAASAVSWVLFMAAGISLWQWRFAHSMYADTTPTECVFMYVCTYSLLSLSLWRLLLRNRCAKHWLWLFPPVFCILGTIVPVILNPTLYTHGDTHGLWQVGNLATLHLDQYRHIHTLAGLVGIGLGLVANLSWLLAQVRAFSPPPAAPLSTTEQQWINA